MRKLIAIITIFFGLWGGYWFVGSTALETGLKDYLSTRHSTSDPVHVGYSDLSVRGFPNRFDTRLSDISVTNAARNIRWQAPFFQIHALSYKPYHIIAALPNRQTLQLPAQKLQIDSAEIKGSVVFLAGSLLESELQIERSSFVANSVTVTSDMGWETSVKHASIATRPTPADALHYDLVVSADNIALPTALRAMIDPAHLQPALFDALSINATLGFTHPWNLLAKGSDTPVLNDITVNSLTLLWDDLRLSASGALQVDPNGFLTGQLALSATNWQKMYRLAESANAVDPDFAQVIQNGLRGLAAMSKGENEITAPLIFANGQMSLGPLPIGPAPRFR